MIALKDNKIRVQCAMVDPGFPTQRDVNPKGREGLQTYYLANFSRKLHGIEQNLVLEGVEGYQ